MIVAMIRKSKKGQPSLNREGQDTLGQRITRLRKERGYTQAELAEKMETIQRLISDYERDILRPHPEMITRFALALKVTTDELLGIKPLKSDGKKANLKILRRLKKIEDLPQSQQKTLLKTIDMILKASEK